MSWLFVCWCYFTLTLYQYFPFFLLYSPHISSLHISLFLNHLNVSTHFLLPISPSLMFFFNIFSFTQSLSIYANPSIFLFSKCRFSTDRVKRVNRAAHHHPPCVPRPPPLTLAHVQCNIYTIFYMEQHQRCVRCCVCCVSTAITAQPPPSVCASTAITCF